MTNETPTPCGIPDCRQPRQSGYEICEHHLDLGYHGDYERYLDLIEDGASRHQAAVLTGLKDPVDQLGGV